MLLDKNANGKIVYLTANISGDILYYKENNSSIDIQYVCNKGIDSIIDRDCFLKLSMRDHGASFIITKLKNYRNGLIISLGNGISRRFEILLFENGAFCSVDKVFKSLKAASDIMNGNNEERREILILNHLFDAKRTFDNIYKGRVSLAIDISENELAAMEPGFSKIIIICILFMLSEIIMEGEIKISACDTEYGKMISFSVTRECTNYIKGIYDFCSEYPSLSAIAAFLLSVCNERGVELIFTCHNGETSIASVFPSSDTREFSVYNRLTDDDLLRLYGIFAEIFTTVQDF